MPQVTWEWKMGPQTIISALTLLVMLGGLIGVFTNIVGDIKVAQQQVSDLRIAVTALTQAQTKEAVNAASIEAKVDILMPMIQQISDEVRKQDGRGRQ